MRNVLSKFTVPNWLPNIGLVTEEGQQYLKVVDWFGGVGAKPVVGLYAGAEGWVHDRADAVTIQGGGGGGGGAQGPQGPQGAQGVRGFQGFQGVQGFQGNTGNVGSQGNQGAQGPQGQTGAQGNQGSSGPQGAAGTQGASGSQGTQGAQGATGSQGPQGYQGYQGYQGAVGTGTQGNQGTTGSQGPQGAQGPQGGGGGSSTFIALTDVDEANYTGSQGKVVSVNSDADGLEFADVVYNAGRGLGDSSDLSGDKEEHDYITKKMSELAYTNGMYTPSSSFSLSDSTMNSLIVPMTGPINITLNSGAVSSNKKTEIVDLNAVTFIAGVGVTIYRKTGKSLVSKGESGGITVLSIDGAGQYWIVGDLEDE